MQPIVLKDGNGEPIHDPCVIDGIEELIAHIRFRLDLILEQIDTKEVRHQTVRIRADLKRLSEERKKELGRRYDRESELQDALREIVTLADGVRF